MNLPNFDFPRLNSLALQEQARLAATITPPKIEGKSIVEATQESAEHLKEINAHVSGIGSGLEKERDERKAADTENREYSERWNRRNYRLAMTGIIIAALALAAAVIALFR